MLLHNQTYIQRTQHIHQGETEKRRTYSIYIYIYLLYILKHSMLSSLFANASIASATQESIFRQPKIYLYKNITMVFIIQLQIYDKTFK